MLNYVGGSYIYIRKEFAGRLKLLTSSWAVATRKVDELAQMDEGGEEDADKGTGSGAQTSGDAEARTSPRDKEDGGAKVAGGKGESIQNTAVPKTFNDMFMFNTAVMGFSSSTWMYEILNAFDAIVRSVLSPAGALQEVYLSRQHGFLVAPRFPRLPLLLGLGAPTDCGSALVQFRSRALISISRAVR